MYNTPTSHDYVTWNTCPPTFVPLTLLSSQQWNEAKLPVPYISFIKTLNKSVLLNYEHFKSLLEWMSELF